MDFIPGVDGPSDGVPRVLACFSNVNQLARFFSANVSMNHDLNKLLCIIMLVVPESPAWGAS